MEDSIFPWQIVENSRTVGICDYLRMKETFKNSYNDI